MKIRRDELDSATEDYLGNIWKQRGRDCQGVFQSRSLSGPGWGVWYILFGLLGLGSAIYLCWPRPSTPELVLGKTALVAVGCLLLVAGIQVFQARRRMRNPMGCFLYVDALYFWVVNGSEVQVTPIDNATDVNGTHRFQDGTYQHSDIQVRLPAGSLRQTITSQHKAEEFLKFINALIQFRKPGVDPSLAALDPMLLGAVALQLARGSTKVDLSGVSSTPGIPSPHSAARPAATGKARPWLAAAAAGGLAFLLFSLLDPVIYDHYLYWQIPNNLNASVAPLERYLREVPAGLYRDEVEERYFQEIQAGPKTRPELLERFLACCPNGQYAQEAKDLLEEHSFAAITAGGTHNLAALDAYLLRCPNGLHASEVATLRDHCLFAQLPKGEGGDLAPLDKYLADYPSGWHTQEVRNLRDDRRFQQAQTQSRSTHSPLPLRKYLADETNVRHRREAQEQINGFYDEAIQRLNGLARDKGKKTEPQLFALMLALLETLKEIDTPDVHVVFRATQDDQPVTMQEKEQEKGEYEGLLKQHPVDLKAIADRSPDKTAILSRGEVFALTPTQRREQLILDRLRESLNKVLAGDIITLVEGKRGPHTYLETPKSPILEVAYHVSPSGTLYVYTTTRNDGFGLPGAGTVQVNGLLRGYKAAWTITLYTSLTAEPRVGGLKSAPLSQLKYDQQPGDPHWAPYAILLYSSFHDLSTRLVESFALQAAPAPDTFSFQGVVGR